MGSRREQATDAFIRCELEDAFAHDARIDGSPKWVTEVRGGVVHISGWFRDASERQAVARIARRMRGVHAVWDMAEGGDLPQLRCIDIGCGAVKQVDQAVGVDRYRDQAVGVLADLDRGLPFATGSLHRVMAVHVLEHIRDLDALMDDIWRVLAPGGVLHVMVPHAHHVNAIADPTHVRLFHPQTFKHYCRPRPSRAPFAPLAISSDGASVFADLAATSEPLCDDVLQQFFD